MKRSRPTKCEPLVGINNQLAIGDNRPRVGSKTAKLDVLVSSHNNNNNNDSGSVKPPSKRQRRVGGGGGIGASASSGCFSSGASDLSNSGGSGGGGHKPVQQRNAANARERQRMRVLSKAFCRLKTSLPWVPPDTKLSKLDTLRLASCYIAHLKQILDDDQQADGNNNTKPCASSKSSKQNAATSALSAVSASTSKLLSMALPLTSSASNLRSPQFPTLPLMSWPFAARNQAGNTSTVSTTSSCRAQSVSGSTTPGGVNLTSPPRHVGGQLGQLYAQFKDRLLVLPQQQSQQQQQQQQASTPAPPMLAHHLPPQKGQQQSFQPTTSTTTPSQQAHFVGSTAGSCFSTSPPSSWPNISQPVISSTYTSYHQMTMFASPSHQQQQPFVPNVYPTSINSSMLYASSPPNQQHCQQQAASSMKPPSSSCYYGAGSVYLNNNGFDSSQLETNFFQLQQQIHNQRNSQKCVAPLANNRKTATTCPTV